MDYTVGILSGVAFLVTCQELGYFDCRIYYMILCGLLWQALRYVYPDRVAKAEVEISWYALKGGTLAIRACRPVVEWGKGLMTRVSIDGDKIYLVNEGGEVVKVVSTDSGLSPASLPELLNIPYHDFALYEWRSGDDPKYAAHMIRFDTVRCALSRDIDFKFTDVKFLAPQIVIPDFGPESTIDMSEELSANNYYICGNRLFDRPFIAWYLRKHHNIDIAAVKSYRVEFVDSDMKPQAVHPDQAVILLQDSYKIVQVDAPEAHIDGLRHRTPASPDKWEKENAVIRAGKKSQEGVVVNPDSPPSHVKWPWAQIY